MVVFPTTVRLELGKVTDRQDRFLKGWPINGRGILFVNASERTKPRIMPAELGFPNYALTNNSANIRRLEKRLAAIKNAQDDETTEEQFPGGVRLVENVEANRLQIFFSEFPRKRSAENSSVTAFTGPLLPELGNGTGANRATYLARLVLTNHTRCHLQFSPGTGVW